MGRRVKHTLGEMVKFKRIEQGLTQKELSKLAKITQSEISNIENALLDATFKQVSKLADTLHFDHFYESGKWYAETRSKPDRQLGKMIVGKETLHKMIMSPTQVVDFPPDAEIESIEYLPERQIYRVLLSSITFDRPIRGAEINPTFFLIGEKKRDA